VTDDAAHCSRTVGLERAAPAQDNEVALPWEFNDRHAGVPLSDCKTHLDAVPCTANRAQPVEKLPSPGWPLMMGMINTYRGNTNVPGSVGVFGIWCRDVQYNEFRRGQ
jgi:hypothetical protein